VILRAVKTAVSIPDELFRHAEALAKRLGKTRSQIYEEALAEYVARREPRAVTAALDGVVEEVGTDVNDWSARASRTALKRNDW